MKRNYSIKVLTKSVIDESLYSFGYTESILIGNLAQYTEGEDLIIMESLLDEIKKLVEDEYTNALNQPLRHQFVKIVDVEEFDASIKIPELTMIMQYPYLFEEPLTTEAFLKIYEIGADIT